MARTRGTRSPATPRKPRTPTCVWTTSVSISCYRLFPPNLHTQNNLTVQRRYGMLSPFHTYHSPFSFLSLPSLSSTVSLGISCVPTGSTRPVCAANKFPFSQPTRATCLALPLLLSLSPPPSDQRIPLEFVILHNCCIWSPSAAKLICQMENCHFVSNVAHAARGQHPVPSSPSTHYLPPSKVLLKF